MEEDDSINSSDVKAVAILKKGGGRSLKANGPWIFDNEIERVEGAFEDGDIVRIEDFDGFFLGIGFINTKSKIRIRMLSRKAAAIDLKFLKMRLKDAWEYRKKCVDIHCCRIVFGEADFLPGLVIDKYEDILVVSSLSKGTDRLKETIIGLQKEILLEDGIKIRGVFERSDSKERLKEGMSPYKGFIEDEFHTTVRIEENGVKYYVDVLDGQKTGFFLDQKYNRKSIQKLCNGAKVLDCFTHTGGFALNAGLAGAESVLGVDASDTAIAQAKKNAALNNLEDKVNFIVADVFELLPSLYEKGERYDLVILDPPAFSKSKSSLKNAVKGYREINLRGMKLVKDGGYLATCSCSHFMDTQLFEKTLREAASGAHVRLRQVEFRTQSPDHPVLWGAGESYYLKFFIFQVFEEK